MTRFVFITGGVVSSLGKGLAAAAIGALLQARGYSRPPAQARPLPQRRSGDHEPLPARRGLRHRRRRRDRPRSRPLRALHRRAGARQRQRHGRQDLLARARQGAPRRLSRRHRPGRAARHRHDQGVHPRRRSTTPTSCCARSAARSATSRACRSSRRSASSASSSGRDRVAYVHLTLVPYLASAGELKTKPTQHSVRELRGIGIQPDMLLCRAERPIPPEARRKIALQCNVRPRRVIPALDVASIYEVPIRYHEEGLDTELLRHFGLPHERRARPRAAGSEIVERLRAPRGRGHDRRGRQVHRPAGRLQVARRGADARRHRQPGHASTRAGSTPRSSNPTTPRCTSRTSTASSCRAASASAAPPARSPR